MRAAHNNAHARDGQSGAGFLAGPPLAVLGTWFTVQVQWPSGWHTDQQTAGGFRVYEKAVERADFLRVTQGLPVRIRTLWGRP